MINKKYSKAFSEVYSIILILDEKLKSKIPDEIIENIKKNKDENYIFKFDNSRPIDKQDISEEAKSILAYLYKNYICSDEEKQKWKEYDRFRNKKMEELKKKKFESNN